MLTSSKLPSSTYGHNTFDSEEGECAEGFQEPRGIRRGDPGDCSFRKKRSPTTVAKNCRRTVSRRRQADTLSVASSLRSTESTKSTSPYTERRRESTAGGGREHVRTTAMLVAVVLCFVVVELPQGLLAFLSKMYFDICEKWTYTLIYSEVRHYCRNTFIG